jgi:hypothetical protein
MEDTPFSIREGFMPLSFQQTLQPGEDREGLSAEERQLAALEAIAESLSAIKLELTSFNHLYAAGLRAHNGAKG